ncbi:MAG: MFS transporter [SAR202 cluster bacterium]|nr:MFS transporter [SAR202 cluster bacterium]
MQPSSRLPLLDVLRNRNFRFLWGTGVVSATVEMSEILVLSWLVLQLTDSAWYVALVGVCRTGSMFAFSLFSGALGDRFDRRRIMMVIECINIAVVASIIAILAADFIQPWHLFIAAVIRGGVRSFDNTCRRALTFQVVQSRTLIQAVSLDHVAFSTGKIVGPISMGALLQVTDTAVSAYSAIAAFHLVSLFCLFMVKVDPASPAPPRRPVLASITEGMRHAFSTPPIAGVLAITVPMNTIFQYQLFIPVIARDHLHVGPGLMGLLAAADGIGFIIGSVAIGLWGHLIKYHGRIFLIGSLGVCVLLAAFAVSPWYPLSFLLLVAVGFSQVGFSTMQAGILLLASPQNFHGRVFGAQQVAVGTGNFGSLQIGALAAVYEAPAALAANGIVGAALLLIIALLMPALRRPLPGAHPPPTPALHPSLPQPTSPSAKTSHHK